MTQTDTELVDLYADERPGMPRNVIAAFITRGIEPPRSDLRGYTAAEQEVIQAYYKAQDPNNARADLKAGDDD